MEPLSVSQLALRVALALAVVAWGWNTPPLQQLVTGCAAGVVLVAMVKPGGRSAALLDAMAVSLLQVYSPIWLPLSAWVITTHRSCARSVAFLLAIAPFLYSWRTGGDFLWWAALFGTMWLYIGFALYEPAVDGDRDDVLLPLPDDLREQWEQEREAHRQLRYQYQELVSTHRHQMAQFQTDRARLQILQAAVTADDPSDLARQMLLILRNLTGAPDGVVWFYDEYTACLKLAHATTQQTVSRSIALPVSSSTTAGSFSLMDAAEQVKATLLPQGLTALTFVLHDEKGVAGAVALFGWPEAGEESSARDRLQRMRDTLCAAIRVVYHLHSLRQENRTLKALYEIGRLPVVSSASVEEAGKKLTSVVAELLSVPFVTLYLRDPDTGTLQVAASVGEPIRLMDEHRFTADEGLAGWIAQRAQPLYLPHTSTEPKLVGYASKRVFASLIGAPLTVRGQVEGVVLAAHTTPGYFHEHHLEQLVSAANHFAQVVEVSRLTRSVGLLALTDGLTGLFNRRYMNIRLEEEINRSQRYGKRFSVILVDIDHFKRINDTWGHATGDLVLQEVSRKLVENVRETEMVFRYGGEEFVVLLPETSLLQATQVAQRLRGAVEQHHFHTVNGSTVLHVTLSAGVAEYPAHGSDRTTLLAAADQALYIAKQQGRNRVEQVPSAA